MLKIKTYLDKSDIAGIGCFASEDIHKGSLIWEFDDNIDRVYTQSQFDMLSENQKYFMNIYTWKQNSLYYLCMDNGRFINHSENPNTIDPINENNTVAKRLIKKGEEILSDYSTFGVNENDHNFNLKFKKQIA